MPLYSIHAYCVCSKRIIDKMIRITIDIITVRIDNVIIKYILDN